MFRMKEKTCCDKIQPAMFCFIALCVFVCRFIFRLIVSYKFRAKIKQSAFVCKCSECICHCVVVKRRRRRCRLVECQECVFYIFFLLLFIFIAEKHPRAMKKC